MGASPAAPSVSVRVLCWDNSLTEVLNLSKGSGGGQRGLENVDRGGTALAVQEVAHRLTIQLAPGARPVPARF